MSNGPIPTPSIDDLDDDPLAERENHIFSYRELLRIGHVPDSDRIVGRDAEIEAVEELLRPGVFGDPPGNSIVYGKTGSGKSLVARHVTGRARAIAQTNGVSLVSAYVDCDQCNTITRVARSLAQQAEQQSLRSIEIPSKGIGSSEYMDYLYRFSMMLTFSSLLLTRSISLAAMIFFLNLAEQKSPGRQTVLLE